MHSRVFSTSSFASPLNYLPWLAKVAPSFSGWHRFQKAVDKARDLLLGSLQKHFSTYDKDNMRDFMDVYIKEIQSVDDPSSSFYKNVGRKKKMQTNINVPLTSDYRDRRLRIMNCLSTDENMLMSIGSLFGAGSETTGNTLTWSFYFLAKHPEVQQKLFEEIRSVVGTSRLPSVDSRSRY